MKFYSNINKVLLALLALLCFALPERLEAQDQQFTQFYAAPLYLNPAFTGTSVQSRVALNYRNQWPGIPGAFVSYNASYDQFFEEWNSGLGAIVSHDRAGSGGLAYTQSALTYAYEIRLNRKLSIRPSLQAGLGMVQLDLNKLTFGDQLARGEGVTTIDPDRARFQEGTKVYPDFGTGVLFFSEQFWLGASVHHLNNPNYSLLQKDTRLPRKYSMHGGIRFKPSDRKFLRHRQYIIAAFNYKSQEKFDQLDLGLYYEYDPFSVGVWYRGLPGLKKNNYGVVNQDALAILVGYQVNNYRFGYSYDITISPLYTQTGGTHEISVVAEFASKKKKKKNKRRVIPCAKF